MSVDSLTLNDIFSLFNIFDNDKTYETLIHPMVESIIFNGDRKPWYKNIDSSKEPKYNLDEGNNEYNPYGKNGNQDFKVADLTDELPEYDLNDLKDDYNPWDYVNYYRYAINAMFVGLPWSTTALLCMAYNLYFNIAWNKFWASLNSYLVFNTFYLAIQVINSIPLMFEFPLWMRAFRVTRILSFLSAILYNLFYVLSFAEWYDQIYVVTDKANYDFVTVMINMLLGYHLVLHSSVVVVNSVIILKEFSLNFISVEGEKRKNEEDVYLNTSDLQEAEKDINPVTYVDDVWEKEFGHDVEDYVIENKKDENAYILNWGKQCYSPYGNCNHK